MWAIAGVTESGEANHTDSDPGLAGLTWAVKVTTQTRLGEFVGSHKCSEGEKTVTKKLKGDKLVKYLKGDVPNV